MSDSAPNFSGDGTGQVSEPESLILGSGAQLALLDVDEAGLPAEAYALGEAAGQFTGERIFSRNPQLYRAIVNLLARAVPYREISEICGVSVNTVCGVAQREGVPIETLRERIGRMGLDVAALTIEAIRDLLADPLTRGKLTLRDLAIAHGIAVQNAQLLLGGATSRVENADATAKPGHDDYLALIRNVTVIGSSPGNPAQKEARDRAADAAIEVASTMPSAAGEDLSGKAKGAA